MATIKSYTDINQSRKLAEILPLESADMHYSKDFDSSWFVDLAEYTSVKIPKYVNNIEEHLLPCWSLAALLDVLPNYQLQTQDDGIGLLCSCNGKFNIITEDNTVDACVTMIEKLHELNLL